MKRALVIGQGRIGRAIGNSLVTHQIDVHLISSRLNFSQSLRDIYFELSDFDIIIWVARDAGLPSNPNNCSNLFYDLLKLIEFTRWSGFFVFASSAGEIYGEVNTSGALESDSISPMSMYGHLKAIHEKKIMALSEKNSFKLLILRISNVYELSLNDSGIVGAILRSILRRELLEISGGSQIRDFISLSDLAIATTRLIISQKTGVFNVASGESISINKLETILENKCQRKVDRKQIVAFEGIRNSRISNLKLRQTLGWEPKLFVEYLEENYPYV